MASNSSGISSALERLSYGAPDGCIVTGLHREVIKEGVATRTLLPEESGSLVCHDLAAGTVFTLPSAVKGMQFQFVTTVSRTSTNAHKVIAASGDFLLGAYHAMDATIATSGASFTGNGTTHVAILMDADTEGGLVGGWLQFTAISDTQWFVTGHVVGTGTMTTAFSTT